MTDPIEPVPAREPAARTVAPGVERLAVLFTNAYLVGATDAPHGPWVMVDAGLPGVADRILRAALARRGRPPEAIVLTHGHSDHAGSAAALASAWGIPVYAHPRELPFVTGRSPYPPPDPTVGGLLALVSRVVPYPSCD